MDIADLSRTFFAELRACMDDLDLAQVARVAQVLVAARDADGTIYLAGNGGSAATASHLASDLGQARTGPGGGALRAVCLTDNVAAFSASANDTSYADALAELVARHVRATDVLLLISGSSSSPNVVRAAQVARQLGITVVGLAGSGGGDLAREVDHLITTQTSHYGVVESLHLALGHLLSLYLSGEERLEHPDRRPGSSLSP